MRGISLLIALAGGLLLGATTMAQTLTTATLAWTPSPSAGVTGYFVYYGTSSGNYPNTVYVSGANNSSVTLYGLTTGVTYYIAATAVDSEGGMSALSPEISVTAGSVAPTSGMLSAITGLPAGQFGFTLPGASGAPCTIQASTDLVHWITLQTNYAASEFVDSNAAQFPRRFYRTVYSSN
jgi:hypothetical protein